MAVVMSDWVHHIRQTVSLRERLALAMGAFVLITGLGVTVLMEQRLAHGLQQSAQQRLTYEAKDIAHSIEADLNERRLEIARLALVLGAAEVVHASTSQQIFDSLLDRVPAYAWIGLTNARGEVVASSGGLLRGTNVAQRPWYVNGSQREFLGDPHTAKLLAPLMPSPVQGEPLRFFDVATPVQNVKGQPQGVLGAHLYTDWIRQVVQAALSRRTNDPVPMEIFVADGSGQRLYQYPSRKHDELAVFLKASEDGRHLLVTESINVLSDGDGPQWSVVARVDTAEAFASVNGNRREMLVATPVVAALLMLATWLVAGRMAKPMERLADLARQHAATTGHQLDAQVSGGRDETGLVDQTLSRLALTDPLTGLINRSALKHHAAQLQQAKSRAGPVACAVLLLNLDDFHVFNNTRGHEVGDQMLRAVANRLRQLASDGAIAARLGSDEFALVMGRLPAERAQAEQHAQALGERVLQAFAAPFEISAGVFRCPASIGIALALGVETSPEEALTHAELAMQEAKSLGKRQAILFNDQMQDRLIAEARFEQELQEAVPSQLLVLFQPQVGRDGKLLGAELLVRWEHPVRGKVSPASFIPVAERNGLIIDIGRWVLAQACQHINAWQNDPVRQHWVLSVNVSAREFSHPDYADHVEQLLVSTGANPVRLKLELTESALAADVNLVVARMRQLKALGITFSLDDFGTGFSSLSYLQRMPIDQLKIDQSFVRQMLNDPGSASIVRTVIALGQSLGLQVIAEGVETQEQRRHLAVLGCHHYQGYLFGKPEPVSSLVG